MKNLKTLDKSELKNVLGGGMDKDTWLQWCLDHITTDTDDPTVAAIVQDVREDQCYSMWEGMSA